MRRRVWIAFLFPRVGYFPVSAHLHPHSYNATTWLLQLLLLLELLSTEPLHGHLVLPIPYVAGRVGCPQSIASAFSGRPLLNTARLSRVFVSHIAGLAAALPI